MRHGRPAIDTRQWLSARDFGNWIRQYDAAAIDPAAFPPDAAISQARQAACVLCSTLARSLTSARALGIAAPHDSNAAFRELEMPHADWRHPRLPVGLWSVLFRLLWLFGYHRHAESISAGRARAFSCAGTLEQLAAQHGKVLFIGHGSLNWFIARALRRAGWQSSNDAARRYWQYAVFSRTANKTP